MGRDKSGQLNSGQGEMQCTDMPEKYHIEIANKSEGPVQTECTWWMHVGNESSNLKSKMSLANNNCKGS